MDNLAYLRKEKGLSGQSVADVLGVSKQAYFNYEQGTSDISVRNLKILADFYGVDIGLITSSALLNLKPPIIKFPTLVEYESHFDWTDEFVKLTSFNSSLIAVKYDNFLVKIFETNNSYMKDHELLFEFNKKIYVATIYYAKDGDGFFFNNGNVIKIDKKDKNKLAIMGSLLATINKEYEKDTFF